MTPTPRKRNSSPLPLPPGRPGGEGRGEDEHRSGAEHRFIFILPAPLYRQLESWAREDDRSVASLVRVILAGYARDRAGGIRR